MLYHLISLVRHSSPHHWLWQGVMGSSSLQAPLANNFTTNGVSLPLQVRCLYWDAALYHPPCLLLMLQLLCALVGR